MNITPARLFLAVAAATTLAGCMSLTNLNQYPPAYTGPMKGNYYDLAECAKARQSKEVTPGSRIDLLHDKAATEAIVTWSTDLGTFNAFVFKSTAPNQTELTVYAALGLPQRLTDLTLSCAQA